MVLFRSKHPDLQIPEDLTTWGWLFESQEHSPLYAKSDKPLGSFTDVETKERLDFAEVKAKATALSTVFLKQYHLVPEDTVAIFSANSVWYPVCMFAAIRAGGRLCGASPALTADEMAFALKTAKAKIVVVPPTALDRAVAAAKQVGIETSHILLTHGLADGFCSLQDLIRQGEDLPAVAPYQIPRGSTNKDICGYLNFSSGTTGLPKAVMISHHNMIAQAFQNRHVQVDPDQFKTLAVMPLFHITGTLRFIHIPLFLNGEAIMLPTFTMRAMLQAMVDYQIEELISVPPILLRLARDSVVNDYDLRHVKRLISGAAPISPEVLKSLEQRFPWTGFRQGYGTTETTAALTVHPPGYYDYKYGPSQGMLLPNVVAKVISPEGEELGPGQLGEVVAKAPSVFLGYLENEKATREAFDKDGFYCTGDSGYFDEEGFLHIQDRIKEMIKVKGTQVPPAELEDLLFGHEDIEDCAVAAQPDEYAGERPKAYIVLKDGVPINEITGHRILEYVRRNKVRYKWLIEVEFVDKIPKSLNGKVLRRVLKERERHRENGGVILGFRVKDEERGKTRTQDHTQITVIECEV